MMTGRDHLVRRARRQLQTGGVGAVAQSALAYGRRRARALKHRAQNPIFRVADRHRWSDANDVYGEQYYLKRQQDPRRSDAQHVAAVLDDWFGPDSVVDFGCAIGHYLEPFHDDGRTVLGIDACVRAKDYAVIPSENIAVADLRDPYRVDDEYDLAICFEVAEHVADCYAETLVETVTNAADTVAWTAATPGQGGTHHVNEQPRAYWIDRFEAAGYRYDRGATAGIRQDLDVDLVDEIPGNLFIFQSNE